MHFDSYQELSIVLADNSLFGRGIFTQKFLIGFVQMPRVALEASGEVQPQSRMASPLAECTEG